MCGVVFCDFEVGLFEVVYWFVVVVCGDDVEFDEFDVDLFIEVWVVDE